MKNTYMKIFTNIKKKKNYVFIDDIHEKIVVYTTLIVNTKVSPFANKGLLELSYFNGFPSYCNNGIEIKILDVVEEVASKISNTITLSVGLHEGYSSKIIYKERIYSRWQLGMV